MNEWFTPQELAGLPGMPGTPQKVRDRLKKILQSGRKIWRKRAKTKAIEYHLDSLPAETRAHLADQDLQRVAAQLSAPVRATLALTSSVPMPAKLPDSPTDRRELVLDREDLIARATDAQRLILTSRRIILGHIERIARDQDCSVRAACTIFLGRAHDGKLPTEVMGVLGRTQAPQGRKSGDGIPSIQTLQRWISVKRSAGSDALLPADTSTPDLTPKPWHAVVMALYGRPQKPTIRSVFDQICMEWKPEWGYPPGAPAPSYQQVLRFLQKVSESDKMRGRYQGSALREKKFYQHRTSKGLNPWDEIHADGWNTHFTAPHPVTGEFVSYEIWHFHDVATRYVTPMSIGLTENTDVILEGLRECIRFGGVPLFLQTDSTGSIKNDRVEFDPVAGLSSRVGMKIVHPKEVGNSQANGIAENFNTWLDRESRELATYQNPKTMDSLAFKRVTRAKVAMAKAAKSGNIVERDRMKSIAQREGKGLVFESHAQAIDWIRSKEQKWNLKPHRELPKLRGADGKMVHMSPAQALQSARERGWVPELLTDAELRDAFRLHVIKKVTRGAVSAYGGQRYRAPEFDHIEGSEVMVAVDPDDWARVWIKDLEGRFIAVAEFVHASGYRAQTIYEMQREKRANAQIKRRENQIDQIEQRMAAPAIEASAAEVIELPVNRRGPESVLVERVEQDQPAEEPVDLYRLGVKKLREERLERERKEAEEAELARAERLAKAGPEREDYFNPMYPPLNYYSG